MVERRVICEHCGGALGLRARGDARFCATRCRVAAFRQARRDDALVALRRRPRWVRWTTVVRQGRPTKMPLTPSGAAASSTDPGTWSRYRDVAASRVGDGAGFVLNGDGVVCIDIDHCVRAGRLLPWAADVLEAVGDTYVELSPGGRGVHVWGLGSIARGRVVRVPGGKLECYGSGRYITVTGRPVGDVKPLADISEFLRVISV